MESTEESLNGKSKKKKLNTIKQNNKSSIVSANLKKTSNNPKILLPIINKNLNHNSNNSNHQTNIPLTATDKKRKTKSQNQKIIAKDKSQTRKSKKNLAPIKIKNIKKTIEENNETEKDKIIENEKESKNQISDFFHFPESNNDYILFKNSKFDIYSIHNPLFEIREKIKLPLNYKVKMNRYGNMPICLTETCKNAGIQLTKNMEGCNIVWKLLHPDKMRELIRSINKCQKYNHFPTTYQLGRKDNMYRHYRYYNKIFPNDYNYTPLTFILPFDGEKFEVEYNKSKKKNLWIVKPVNMSRGRGVHILKNEEEFKIINKKSEKLNITQYLVSKYISNPHTINQKKYDLRVYILITSYTPLKIYLYNNGLVRFATENYEKGNYNNIFIHLTNYSINKKNSKYKSNDNDNENDDENEPDDSCDKWSLYEYRNYFIKNNQNQIFNQIWIQVKDIIIKTIMSIANDATKEISSNKINTMFEIYGFDILIDSNFKAWLIEVNVNPSLHCSSPLDLNIKSDLIADTFNIVGIQPYHQLNNELVFHIEKNELPQIINQNQQGKNMNNGKNNNNNNINNNKNNNNNTNNNNNKNNNNNNKNNKKDKNKKEETLLEVKTNVVKNFNEKNNLKNKMKEYENPFYQNMINHFIEERARSEITGYNLLFPRKENIEQYSIFLTKEGTNDTNIVMWNYLLTLDNY